MTTKHSVKMLVKVLISLLVRNREPSSFHLCELLANTVGLYTLLNAVPVIETITSNISIEHEHFQ